ncbi:MAG: IPT/TIG domain-containing protein, partial [Deltaproteobacteria bacterium]|nr:IPT/TIG domain-containing protein [Deltaproteobacteria bacterium]
MKWTSVLFLSLLGIVLVSQVEAAGRYSECGTNMDAIYSPDSGRYYCQSKKVKPPEPPKAPAPVLPPLTLSRFEPTSVFGGETITIYGSGFTPGRISTVNIGGARSYATVVSPTELKTIVNTSAKTGPVILEPNHGMGSAVSSSQTLQVHTGLVLTKVEPAQAKAGTFINVYAKGGTESDRCRMSIGGIHQATFLYHSGVAMNLFVPKEAKNGEIFMDCGGEKQARNNNLFQLIVEKPPEPRITSIYPAGGIEKNNQISIFGINLQNAKEVTFNGTKGSINASSADQIRVITPNIDGTTKIVVTTPQGSAVWENYVLFKTKPPPEWKPSPPPVAEKPKVTPPPQEITRNALGDPELCFGAVGKGCGGFDDLKEGEKKETHPLWFTAGCSVEVGGMRRCWVVPGSIKHDNCCVKHPSGKQCGGPGRNPFNRNEPDKDWITGQINKAGEFNHDNNCVQEWDDAVWDVKNGRGWEVDFPAHTPANLTPSVSPEGRYGGGEVTASVNLCASNGSSISARHSTAFCCSRNAKKYWAVGVEDWLICEPKTAGRSTQRVASKQKGTPPPKLDMTKPPSKPGQPKTVATPALAPVAPRSAVKERETKPIVQPQPALLPPPPPPSQIAKEKPKILPQPALTPRGEEPEQKWAAPEESEG